MTDERDDINIDDAIARLRHTIGREVPPVDAVREQALLAAFDAHRTRPRPKTRLWVWTPAVALLAITVGLDWFVVTHSPRIDPVPSSEVVDLTGFVPWPGADAFPRFESGSLVRVDLPVSALTGLGLSAPSSAITVVQADIVVGQDGLARAVRLVQ